MNATVWLICLRLCSYFVGLLIGSSAIAFADVVAPAKPEKMESISPKALHEFSALIPEGDKGTAVAPKALPNSEVGTATPKFTADIPPPSTSTEVTKETPDPDQPKSGIIRVVGHPIHNKEDEYLSDLEGETNAFGSQALPIGGGQFAPYLGGLNERPRLPPPRLIPKSFDDWMHQDNVFGDLGGLRSTLGKYGIDIGGRWLGEAGGNPLGGRSHKARAADEEAFTIDLNTKRLTGWNLGIIHFMAIIRQGKSLADTIPLLDSPMEIAGGGEHAHLGRLSWEMIWNKYVRTEIGDINVEKDFAQSPNYWGANLYCQFQNNGICGMPQSLAMNTKGYSWYPTALPGAWVKFYPAGNNHFLISTGIYSVEPDVYKRRDSWHISTHNSTGGFVPVQLGWHRGGKTDYTGDLQTNIRIGGYWDSSKVYDIYSQMATFNTDAGLLGATNKATKQSRGRYGIWGQVDQMIERDKKDPSRGIAIFGTFEWGDPHTAVAPYFTTFGIVRKGTFASRPDDTISFGGKVLWVNHDLTKFAHRYMRNHAGSKGIFAPSTETTIELNYGYRPAPWLLIRPGAQYAFSPGGTNRYKNAFMLDMEGQIIF